MPETPPVVPPGRDVACDAHARGCRVTYLEAVTLALLNLCPPAGAYVPPAPDQRVEFVDVNGCAIPAPDDPIWDLQKPAE